MPTVSPWVSRGIALGGGLVLALMPGIAYAGFGGTTDAAGQSNTKDPSGPSINATAGVQYDTSKNGTSGGGGGVGPLTPTGNWSPPACWYQPTYSPKDMKSESEKVWSEDSPSEEWKSGQKDRYVNGKPYKNFNLDQQGKGYFWQGYSPPQNGGMPGADSCNDEPFWVPIGQAPPPEHKNAVTPAILAELAYEQILIPQGTARTNPAGTQTVNLPTWVWMDGADFHPVSVRAYLPDYNVEATTTATPVSLQIDPGTSDARLFPASGTCKAGAGNTLGVKYTDGAKGDPPCGVTYLRSTDGGSYQLTATVTWRISWTGTGQATPKQLPSGTFGTPQEVTVREIQTVNR
ncbi:hypothetical protein [Streptomyces sp. NBC_00448]|uniref:hypothetical protein n=1 Tax=Streptomyces sp. NBC_00448 TaxID=2903652 RepID=UPI002E22E2B7